MPIEESWLRSLPGVTACRRDAGGWLLETGHVNETIVGVVRGIESGKNELVDLRIVRPSLEDVFLSLTGQAWDGGTKEAK